jgi:hypothetical protein
VTVPKPFNFDLREKTRTKTIREKKVEEMVMEKRKDEDKVRGQKEFGDID